jgi:hypothetical protein
MPTEYTAKLMEKGQDFDEFVMTCARAFGACILMRDDFYETSLKAARAELLRLESMTNQERIDFGVAKKAERIFSLNKSVETDRAENARLEEMRDKVQKWNPPSPDHVELKNFMLNQIEISMNSFGYYERELAKLNAASPYELYAEVVGETQRGIESYEQGRSEEQERTADRNKWIKQLRESLK